MNLNTTNSIRNFTITQASGRQYFFEPGKWYDMNKIKGKEDDTVKLQRLLLHKNDEKIILGKPCIENTVVLGMIVQHFRGKKVCVFKYKQKKTYKRKIGFRPSLSRIVIKRGFENF